MPHYSISNHVRNPETWYTCACFTSELISRNERRNINALSPWIVSFKTSLNRMSTNCLNVLRHLKLDLCHAFPVHEMSQKDTFFCSNSIRIPTSSAIDWVDCKTWCINTLLWALLTPNVLGCWITSKIVKNQLGSLSLQVKLELTYIHAKNL